MTRLKARSWLRAGAAVMALGIVIAFASVATAVHNAGLLELDTGTLGANATDSTGSGLPDDWDRVCYSAQIADGKTAAQAQATCTVSSGAATTSLSWKAEGTGVSIFTSGGSKDNNDIDQWAWKNGSGVADKADLLHAFAARYTCGVGCDTTTNPEVDTGDSIVYFGADRFDNSGDTQMGFWFLQGEVAATGTGKAPGSPFTDSDGNPAEHVVGDVLVLSDFTNGGVKSTIRVFMWDPGHTPATDLVDGVLLPLAGGSESDATCGSATDDEMCAIVNTPATDTLTDAPWAFEDKSHHADFARGELYEGGLNLSKVVIPGSGGKTLADECFATFAAETRESASVDSVLDDFVIDAFQPCESGIVTTPTNASIVLGQSNTDGAVVTGTGGGTPTGTVKFFVCSPSQLDDASPTDDPNTCDVGGTFIDVGADEPNGEPLTPATATTATATSEPFTPTGIGTWCFRGEYVPGIGSPYDPAVDSATTECFTVTTVPSNITTSQFVYPNDSATITIPSGAGGNPTGSVKFRLYDTLANCQATTPSDTVGQGGLLFKQTIALPGTAPFTVSTTNTTASVSASSTVAWLVEFTSTNQAQRSRKSVCVERTALTFTNDAGPGTDV